MRLLTVSVTFTHVSRPPPFLNVQTPVNHLRLHFHAKAGIILFPAFSAAFYEKDEAKKSELE